MAEPGVAAVLRWRHPCVSGPLCDVCTDGSLKFCRLAAHSSHTAAVVQLMSLCTLHYWIGTARGPRRAALKPTSAVGRLMLCVTDPAFGAKMGYTPLSAAASPQTDVTT